MGLLAVGEARRDSSPVRRIKPRLIGPMGRAIKCDGHVRQPETPVQNRPGKHRPRLGLPGLHRSRPRRLQDLHSTGWSQTPLPAFECRRRKPSSWFQGQRLHGSLTLRAPCLWPRCRQNGDRDGAPKRVKLKVQWLCIGSHRIKNIDKRNFKSANTGASKAKATFSYQPMGTS